MSNHKVTESELEMAQSNMIACAYNAAVNYGTERGVRKMRDLIYAINQFHRIEGLKKMQHLVSIGLITEFKSCDDKCEVRPGGLFHAPGCENDFNHPVYRDRYNLALHNLAPKDGGGNAASVTLVGKP